MRALIVENDEKKAYAVSRALADACSNCECVVAGTHAAAVRELDVRLFDIIILDVHVPPLDGSPSFDSGANFVLEVQRSLLNSKVQIIALTAYEDVYARSFDAFLAAGVVPLRYSNEDDSWRKTLVTAARRVERPPRQDFIIFCALEKERQAFVDQKIAPPGRRIMQGLDVTPAKIAGFHGLIVVPPRMGLVDAAVISALAVKSFEPRVVAVAGICGGYKKHATLAQLIVATQCWEHQTGKVTPAGQELELYPWELEEQLRLKINRVATSPRVQSQLYAGLRKGSRYRTNPLLGPMLSGSAVIASKRRAKEIFNQHRKAAGVDMEMFAVLRAIEIANSRTACFGAKAVVGFADARKNDSVHTLGAAVSARFVKLAIAAILEN